MRLLYDQGLFFVAVTITYQGRQLTLNKMLVDTGSAGTLLPTDPLASIGCVPSPTDLIDEVVGIGGTETVYIKHIDALHLSKTMYVHNLEVEVGMAKYGFGIEGILGLNFLTQVGAILDLERLEIRKGRRPKG